MTQTDDLAAVAGIVWRTARGATVTNPPRPQRRDLDSFPWPDREAIDIVAQSPIAVALLSEGFVRTNNKQVKVVKTPAMKRPLSIITRDEPSADLKAIIKFLKSPEAKKLFK